jgi:hypothetical protein
VNSNESTHTLNIFKLRLHRIICSVILGGVKKEIQLHKQFEMLRILLTV